MRRPPPRLVRFKRCSWYLTEGSKHESEGDDGRAAFSGGEVQEERASTKGIVGALIAVLAVILVVSAVNTTFTSKKSPGARKWIGRNTLGCRGEADLPNDDRCSSKRQASRSCRSSPRRPGCPAPLPCTLNASGEVSRRPLGVWGSLCTPCRALVLDLYQGLDMKHCGGTGNHVLTNDVARHVIAMSGAIHVGIPSHSLHPFCPTALVDATSRSGSRWKQPEVPRSGVRGSGGSVRP